MTSDARATRAAIAFARSLRRDTQWERDLVVVPARVPRARWLYPIVNWWALRLARRVSRRAAVAVVPVR